MIEVNGKKYVKIGDKLAEVDHLDERGKPVLKTYSEQIPNANGGMDCTIHVECLQIASESHQ